MVWSLIKHMRIFAFNHWSGHLLKLNTMEMLLLWYLSAVEGVEIQEFAAKVCIKQCKCQRTPVSLEFTV
jgi:hypothetical protein